MDNDTEICNYEVNFLTEEELHRSGIINEIRLEFDLIRFCQSIMVPYGIDAQKKLDRFVALSMRKLLLDRDNPLVLRVCPDFKMPPFSSDPLFVDGINGEVKLTISRTYIHIKDQSEWIPFDEWKETRIAWIDKNADDVPTTISHDFYIKLMKATNSRIYKYYEQETVYHDNKDRKVWKLIDPETNQYKVYELLKEKGYYELTIHRMIKHIADKIAAHTDSGNAVWISLVNESVNNRYSAISAFATQMMYAATKQIKELKDYWIIEPQLETL